jgi:hypothetical protein
MGVPRHNLYHPTTGMTTEFSHRGIATWRFVSVIMPLH